MTLHNSTPLMSFALAATLLGCNGGSSCDHSCENNGTLSIDCECICPEGFTGTSCETPTCTLECENKGTVTEDCTCECPDGFSGELCEACYPQVNVIERGNIFDSRDNQRWQDDVEVILPDDYVLCGLGFYMASRIAVWGREVMDDGTLGELTEFRDGSNPTGELAVQYIVPEGHVITGFGYGESQDIYRLVVNYNTFEADENCDIVIGPEQLYDNGADRAVEVWIKISENGYNTTKHVLGSVGIKYSGTTSRQVDAQVRELINY